MTVSGISGATSVKTGQYHTCAILGDGSVKCWGWNDVGQLGNATFTDARTPVSVYGLIP